MTLTELRYIVAIVRKKHFARAAKVCHVSQPTLSVAIKKLEAELGVALFERGSNEITPSLVGLTHHTTGTTNAIAYSCKGRDICPS